MTDKTLPRVSIRTLVLTLGLLVAVVSFQYLAILRQPKPGAVWLATEGLKTPPCESTNT
jgi:hypothetical protein